MSDAQIEEAARLFLVLSEPTRLLLLRELMLAPQSVSALVEVTGIKQGVVSKHLGILQTARFVNRERQGHYMIYTLADPRVPKLCELMCARMEEDAKARAKLLAPSP